MDALNTDRIEEWQRAVGRESIEAEVLDQTALRRFARAIGLDGEEDDPPLAHWAFFLPSPRDDAIGADGHPARGGFLPAITLPRRMFASSVSHFDAPLEPGAEARLTTTIARVEPKTGRSGEMVFVDVDRALEQRGTVRVRERQTFVYRTDGAAIAMPRPADQAPIGEVWQPEEANLFRFSAATGNAHRIHYDLPYARDVEGYPALIVHGLFTAARLAVLAQRDGALIGFSFRALAPLFLGQPIYLRRKAEREYEAVRCDGVAALQAQVEFA